MLEAYGANSKPRACAERLYAMQKAVMDGEALMVAKNWRSRLCVFFFQAEDGIRDRNVTGVQTCALPILQKADLSVIKTGPGTAFPGSNVIYTITVTNNGPSDAAAVQLADPTPPRLSPVSVTDRKSVV